MLAKINFEQQGYRAYLPIFLKRVRHARQVKEVYKPLFPGYLFLLLNKDKTNWYAIGGTRGTLGPVSFGGKHVSVPDWVMDKIREREEQPGIISMGRVMEDKLRNGAKVELELPNGTRGEGTVFSHDGERNVIVLLELLKREVKVSVPVEHLRLQAES